MNSKIVTTFFILLISGNLFAHGMNRPGPHGGFIRMPGAFHTELVDKGSKMNVYLIDMSLKNPVVADSSVTITYKGKTITKISCLKENEYFVCERPKEGFNQIEKISISAIRNKIKARDADYEVPLKLDN
jgi:hypothetical protein